MACLVFISRRRSSHGSTYELVDSEAQWREIQERQAHQQSQAATVRPAASSTPVQQQPVQQATVRKASNAVNVSTSSVNDSLLDQSQSDLTAVETNSQTSSRHRHHRKHRHHHKHRYFSSRAHFRFLSWKLIHVCTVGLTLDIQTRVLSPRCRVKSCLISNFNWLILQSAPQRTS